MRRVMHLPWLLQFSDSALLFMRLLVGWVFIWSGWSHTKDPVSRGKSIGFGPGFTRFPGTAGLARRAGVARRPRRRGAGRRAGRGSGRADSDRGAGPRPGHARCHSEEDFRLAHR